MREAESPGRWRCPRGGGDKRTFFPRAEVERQSPGKTLASENGTRGILR